MCITCVTVLMGGTFLETSGLSNGINGHFRILRLWNKVYYFGFSRKSHRNVLWEIQHFFCGLSSQLLKSLEVLLQLLISEVCKCLVGHMLLSCLY